jgi:transposase
MQVINDRCLFRTQDGHRVVIVSGIILAQYAVGDRMAEAHAMVSLVEQGWADQNDVARAFGYAARTVRRQQRRFEDGGLAALGQGNGYPRGRARLATSRLQWVQELRSQGHSNREIARRMGVSPKAIRKLVRRLGCQDPAPVQPELALIAVGPGDSNLSAFSVSTTTPPPVEPAKGGDPNLSAFCSPAVVPPTLDTVTGSGRE